MTKPTSTTLQESQTDYPSRIETQKTPRHVAIIMDGNGRWAEEKDLDRSEGHEAGVRNIRRVVRAMAKHQVEHLTLFAFSTENWDRPASEVHTLIRLLGEAIRLETDPLHKEGVRINHIGRLNRLPVPVQKSIQDSIELTKNNSKIQLNVAYDYGGRDEILDAIQAIIRDSIQPSSITKDLFSQYLYTSDIPDPDFVIRTAGENRLSNFLLWQSAYSEYYSTDTRWPDFDEREIRKALTEYGRRQRRYGKTDMTDVE